MIAVQNNVARTTYIKAKIDNTPEKNKFSRCGDRNEDVNLIISDRSYYAQEYKNRHDWEGRVVYWELCQNLKFHHTNK